MCPCRAPQVPRRGVQPTACLLLNDSRATLGLHDPVGSRCRLLLALKVLDHAVAVIDVLLILDTAFCCHIGAAADPERLASRRDPVYVARCAPV